MDYLDGGALEPCPPHPAIEEFAALVGEWTFASGFDFVLEDRIRILTIASQFGDERAPVELAKVVTCVCDTKDIRLDASDGLDHSVRAALDELRYKRITLAASSLEGLVRKTTHNAASGAVDMIGARGTREAFDQLLRLYADVTDWFLRGRILAKLETLSGRLSLTVYENEDGTLSVVDPSKKEQPL